MALSKYELLVGASAADLQSKVRSKQASGSVIIYGMFYRGTSYCQAVGTGTLDVGTLTDYRIVSSPNIDTFSNLVTGMLGEVQPVGTPVVYNSALFQVMGKIQPFNMSGQNGANGKTPQIQVADGYIQWKYTTDTVWQNLIALSNLQGASADMRVSNSAIQWKRSTDTEWTTLIGMDSLMGPAGPGNALTIGSITTLGAGSQATATITGTSPNQVLNLGIPAGNTGNDGSTPVISIGTVTTLPAGSQATAAMTSGGKLNLGIPAGNAGSDGVSPPVNTLSIGSVTTSAPGGNAAASITGSSPNQVLNLTIPGASKGDPGPANTLSVGTVTTSAAGTQASATITGSSPSQVLNLTLPRGNNGADGKDGTNGEAGPANVLSIGTVTTLQAGSNATAAITGTAPNQTLSLGIPQGGKGENGNTGPANTLSIGTVTTGAAAATITGTAPSQVLNLTVPQGPAGTNSVVETLTGSVVTAGTAVALTFTKTYSTPPVVIPVPQWNGTQMITGGASNITRTGCNFTAMQSRGTLLLTSGPFENASAGVTFRVLVIGN